MKLDLNCDLGEGEPPRRTRALMRWITSANVACGGHAGDSASMARCVRLCKESDVCLGAHPGAWNRADFGRGETRIEPGDLELLLLHQISALNGIAQEQGVPLHHIKLHGALYHAAEADERLARLYIDTLARFWPKARIFARAGGRVARLARQAGLVAWEEAFADRGYRDDGTLVSRTESGAIVTDVKAIVRRVKDLASGRGLLSVSGRKLMLRPQTLCLHSDTPSALVIARAVRNTLHGRK
ncbi:MAG: LamB/YcsF family protein [Verrucomicrobiales bacterium]|nr:LamB/YcsF family protein [Verrucomicrobiales bacterium]